MERTRVVCDECGSEVKVELVFIQNEQELGFCPVCGSDDIMLDDVIE